MACRRVHVLSSRGSREWPLCGVSNFHGSARFGELREVTCGACVTRVLAGRAGERMKLEAEALMREAGGHVVGSIAKAKV